MAVIYVALLAFAVILFRMGKWRRLVQLCG
jgi:hypothetical protein